MAGQGTRGTIQRSAASGRQALPPKDHAFSSTYSMANKTLCREGKKKRREVKSGKNAFCGSCAIKLALPTPCSIFESTSTYVPVTPGDMLL